MRSGDAEPYIACWADRPDTTLFGAWGPIELGTDHLVRAFRWVGGRFTGGETHVENLVVETSGDGVCGR